MQTALLSAAHSGRLHSGLCSVVSFSIFLFVSALVSWVAFTRGYPNISAFSSLHFITAHLSFRIIVDIFKWSSSVGVRQQWASQRRHPCGAFPHVLSLSRPLNWPPATICLSLIRGRITLEMKVSLSQLPRGAVLLSTGNWWHQSSLLLCEECVRPWKRRDGADIKLSGTVMASQH